MKPGGTFGLKDIPADVRLRVVVVVADRERI